MESHRYVFAASTCAVRWRDSVVRLKQGDAWEADAPFVRDRPEFFVPDPPNVHHTRDAEPVETATARPGEWRGQRW